jgi:hypothetical protein
MRANRTLTTMVATTALLGGVIAAAGGATAGVTGPAFYVDGTLFRTVATSTDLSHTAAPAHSFDTIYDFGGAQPNVATAGARRPRLQRRPLDGARARLPVRLRRCSCRG